MDFNREAIDRIIAIRGVESSAVIPILQDVQRELKYISIPVIEYITKKTGIPSAQIYGVATFFTQFRLKPVGDHIIKVCHGTACHVSGASEISESLEMELKVSSDSGTTADNLFTLEKVACLGCCSLAPVVMIGDEVYGDLDPSAAKNIPNRFLKKSECGCESVKNVIDGIVPDFRELGLKGIREIVVGMGSCGIASGARPVKDIFEAAAKKFGLGIKVSSSGCMGICHMEPIVEVVAIDGKRTLYGRVDPKAAKKIIEQHIANGDCVEKNIIDFDDGDSGSARFMEKQKRVVLENCGRIDPESIDDYENIGGYGALRTVISTMKPDEVILEIKSSGLRGRGGAGFPTGLKWQFARAAQGDEKYIICNADEGDPGAFMDRSVIESDPHRVIEGMIIASYAIGARKGYVYCRAEYPLAIRRLNLAIAAARARGFLGENILSSAHSFDLEVKEGAGAFVCGEETALIESIEGKRGMPRIRPPFPASAGLWGKPTNINNVETFANIPWIIKHGASKFASFGTEKSKGTKVFALAGDIKRGGLVEVPMGITLREIVEDIGGGSSSALPVKAVQLGGPSGGCIPARLMDTIVDFDAVNATGAIMGSGGMVIMDESACMVDIAKFFISFTQDESCGKCTFCRIGTRRMLEILDRITAGDGRRGDIELLEELARRIKEASLCGLGQSAPNPVLTTIKYFRDEYEAHIEGGCCPSGKCRALISIEIVPDKCIGCGLCVKACPVEAITGERKKPYVISQELCTKCGMCKSSCPTEAITTNTKNKKQNAKQTAKGKDKSVTVL